MPRWINQVAAYAWTGPQEPRLRDRLWRCWLDIEMRLLPRLHARRYSLHRFISGWGFRI